MADDTERLIVALEARLRDFETNMAKASRLGTTTYRQLQDGSRRATRAMETDMVWASSRINQALAATQAKIGAFAKATAAAFVGGLGLGAVNDAIKSLAATAADAKWLGLGAETLQELAFAADRARVPLDALTDGFKELQLRADQFATTGKGAAAEAFQRIGLSREEVKERLRDPADLLQLITNRVGLLNNAARVRIFDNLFGGRAGAEFLKFIEQGRDGIRVLREEARATGVVLAQDIIDKAAEIDRKFNSISSTISTNIKSAIVDAVDGLERFLARLNIIEVPVSDIGTRSLEITRELVEWEKRLEQARAIAAASGLPTDRARMRSIEERIARLKEEDELLRKRGAREVEEFERRRSFSGNKGGSGLDVDPDAERKVKAYKQLIAAAEGRIDALRVERQALGLTTAAAEQLRFTQHLLTDAKRRDLLLTPDQIDQINALGAAYGRMADELERARESLALTKEFTSTFARDMMAGAKATDALANATKRLTERLADKGLDMALSGLFGALNGQGSGGFGDLFKAANDNMADAVRKGMSAAQKDAAAAWRAEVKPATPAGGAPQGGNMALGGLMAGAALYGAYQSGMAAPSPQQGAMSGGLAGGLAGAVIGNMLFPGVGGIIGGALLGGTSGGLLGFLGGNKAKKEAEKAAQLAALERSREFEMRALGATTDTSTQEGALAMFDARAQQERQAEQKAGGKAMASLEKALAAEREAIIKDFAKRAEEEEKRLAARREQYLDREFAALTDTSTLQGALLAFERRANQERRAEAELGGGAIAELERALAAERLQIETDFAAKAEEQQQRAAEALRKFSLGIDEFIRGLRLGSQSILTPLQQFEAARTAFEQQFGLASGGDQDALGGIARVAQQFVEQARSFLGPSMQFGDIFRDLVSRMESLKSLDQAVFGMAAGGVVGNGRWNRDSVLARFAGGGKIALAGGEGVLTAPATAAIGGSNVIDFINRTRSLPGGANGNGDVVAELRALRQEVAEMRRENTELRMENRMLAAGRDRLIAEGNAVTSSVARGVDGLRTDTKLAATERRIRSRGSTAA